MPSIKRRLVMNFMFIIVITVIIMELFLITGIRNSYYKNLEDTLVNQLQTSIALYERYFSDATLQENVLNNVDTFWKQVTAQVEIIDMEGRTIMNSLGVIDELSGGTADVQAALQGEKGVWVGRLHYDTEKVMAVAYPIRVAEEQVGVLRFVASLSEVNEEIRRVAYSYLLFGGVVVLFSGAVSIFLANTITGPLKQVTLVAEEMARGNYEVKSPRRSKDEIGKLSETLNYLAREIIKKDELKNNFISSVSHELRTPLTSIKGWAVTLKQGFENRELLQDGLDIIEKESDRLTAMVAELLDFSRFVSGKITLKKKKVNLADLLEHLRIQLTPRALREEIDFQIKYEGADPFLYTDEDRLKQVFINLLDNAFKFTAPGGRVSLQAAADNEQLYFYITDNGCGIPPEELPHVKEKFFKGKSSKSQSGIGLSLADEIIRLMKGKLEIASQVGQGTQVTITLPREAVSEK
ncbi:MAG: HAMP domain-containing histidine kinase [Firmicutes bacterium]|nr:HAMP domain-containing histidine kinase [Bacillota bacterium]